MTVTNERTHGPVLSDSFVSDIVLGSLGAFFWRRLCLLACLAFELSHHGLRLMIITLHNVCATCSWGPWWWLLLHTFFFVACWCSREEVDWTLGVVQN